MMVKKGDTCINFDQMLMTKSGFVLGVKMSPILKDCASATMHQGAAIKVEDLHCQLGHVSQEATRQTAKFYGWKLQGSFPECKECVIAKSRQQNMNKEKEPKAEAKGQKIFIDISSIKKRALVVPNSGCLYWMMLLTTVGVFF